VSFSLTPVAPSLDTDLDRAQADALILAGWRWELPKIDNPDIFQWYWRSPPKRKGSKGRKYWSTNQAHNALMRSRS
jgi:hypothetical protein